ncbi:hypothetical protein ACFFLM_06035 [Deinococcus oregonensis]|uniref:Uncharacterized protein n=1 Tax=Deinococcus oregonensis TaxID=1805970 RepID=A0ABV6AY54_9DEIO
MTKKRLELLEARHIRRVTRFSVPNTLAAEAQRLTLALPEVERQTVEAAGVRGSGLLLEAWWESGTGEVTPQTALEAYRLAFEGGTA